MCRGLEAAGNAAVVLRELPLRPVGRDHRGQLVTDAAVAGRASPVPRSAKPALQRDALGSGTWFRDRAKTPAVPPTPAAR